MSTIRSQLWKSFCLVVLALWAAPVWADPLPGEILKFQQLPLNNTQLAPYFGHDVLSTANWDGSKWSGKFAADDFGDKVSTPVVHVKWWGSYLPYTTTTGTVINNYTGTAGVQKFLISFEKDVPVGVGTTFSHPGMPIQSEIVTSAPLSPGSGTFAETQINGTSPEYLYQYNAELRFPFPEQKDTVYWLKIVALVDQATDGPIQWGWHNRDWSIKDTFASTTAPSFPGEVNLGSIASPVWHYQDDAIIGDVDVTFNAVSPQPTVFQDPSSFVPTNYIDFTDGPGQVPGNIISQYSQDLAFELHTSVPEPSAFILGGLGVVGLIAAARRRRVVASSVTANLESRL